MRKAYDVLKDGAWHPYNDVIIKVLRAVPPGRAKRAYHRRRELEGRANAKRRFEIPEEREIYFGARYLARQVLANRNWFERQVIDGVKMVRIRPLTEAEIAARAEQVRRRTSQLRNQGGKIDQTSNSVEVRKANSEKIRAYWASLTPEQRSARNKALWARMPEEKRQRQRAHLKELAQQQKRESHATDQPGDQEGSAGSGGT